MSNYQCADSRILFGDGDRYNIFDFKSDKIVSGRYSDNFLQYGFQLLGRIRHLSEQKININRYSAVKVGEGIDKQAALKHKVFCIFGFLQTAQEFLLAKELQTKLIASSAFGSPVFQSCKHGCRYISHSATHPSVR